MASGEDGDLTPAPTAQERELASVGAAQWNDYKARYASEGGINDKFIAATRATEGDKAAAAGSVGADSAIAKRRLDKATAQAGLAKGISSSSGAALSARYQDTTDTAAAAGLGKATAVQSVEDAQLAADFKLASFGRGLGDESQVGLQRGLRTATDIATKDAVTKAKERQELISAAGTGVGMLTQSQGWLKPKTGSTT